MSNQTHINDHQLSIAIQKENALEPRHLPQLPLLLKRNEVASLLNIAPKKVARFLAAHGIQPIDLGPGRGNGLRWHSSAVIELADRLHTEAQAQAPKPRKAFSPHSVIGKTAAELFAEFNGNGNSPAEVCNGD